MKVPGIIYIHEEFISLFKDVTSFDQVFNVATLPGIIGASYAKPDIDLR
jgi:tRNA-splicing ligase RtcB (3'-phosphate/5'-hydroxy nucleic acid ligase)